MVDQGVPGAAAVRGAIASLRSAMGKDVEMQSLLTLLLVAERGEVTMAELQQEIGVGSSAMSRNIGLLGQTGYRNGAGQGDVEGLDLLVAHENPLDRRQKLVKMTPKGKALMTRVLRKIGAP